MTKNRILCTLLALLLISLPVLALGGSEAENETDTRPYYRFDEAGVKIYVNDDWLDAAQTGAVLADVTTEYAEDGMLSSAAVVLAPDGYFSSEAEGSYYDVAGVVFAVCVAAEGTEADAAEFSGFEAAPIGSVDGYDYTLYLNPDPDKSALDDEGAAFVDAMLAQLSGDPAHEIEIFAPLTEREANALIKPFETVDIYGAALDQALLGQAEYTLIDVWGTFCGPCISEMPDLAALSGEYADKLQFVGIVSDINGADDAATIASAQQIVESAGVKYTSLVPDYSLQSNVLRYIQYVPTKFLVDKYGALVGEPLIGAQGADAIRDWINETLK